MLPLLTEQAFSALKRDPLLDYGVYQVEAQDLSDRIPNSDLIDPTPTLDKCLDK